jgi:hypothetical protein
MVMHTPVFFPPRNKIEKAQKKGKKMLYMIFVPHNDQSWRLESSRAQHGRKTPGYKAIPERKKETRSSATNPSL